MLPDFGKKRKEKKKRKKSIAQTKKENGNHFFFFWVQPIPNNSNLKSPLLAMAQML